MVDNSKNDATAVKPSVVKTYDPPTTAVDAEPASDPYGAQAAQDSLKTGTMPLPTDPNITGQQDADDDGKLT